MRTTFKPTVETLEARDCPSRVLPVEPTLVTENGGFKSPFHQGSVLVLDWSTSSPVASLDFSLFQGGHFVADEGSILTYGATSGQFDLTITPDIQAIADAQWYHASPYNEPVQFTLAMTGGGPSRGQPHADFWVY